MRKVEQRNALHCNKKRTDNQRKEQKHKTQDI